MTEIERILDQFDRAVGDDPWYGPSLDAVLAEVTWEIAAVRPISDGHSIWELVEHIAAWEGAVVERLTGGPIALPAEGDWPEIGEPSAAGWAASLVRLTARHDRLRAVIGSLTEADLGRQLGEDRDPPTGAGRTVYATLHGIIQHLAYHAGQIALLKKIVQARQA